MTLVLTLTLPDGCAPRLDKALAEAVPEGHGLSRSRLQALIAAGDVRVNGGPVTNPKSKMHGGETVEISVPPAAPLEVVAQDIPLTVVHEDTDLIVIDKPAGMVVHPAPGSPDGTLVNALLHHCGDSLSGVGGVQRPGIVHRIDKDTSGLLVVAKSDIAHQGLAAQFARHQVERSYFALVWGTPSLSDPRLVGLPGVSAERGAIRIDAALDRHKHDRKRRAVVASGGKHAITFVRVMQVFGAQDAPFASLVTCRLETGRTHQIRVHMAHVGHPMIGDQTYGKARKPPKAAGDALAADLAAFSRQALHAATLGLHHPVTGELLQFQSAIPSDMKRLLISLETF